MLLLFNNRELSTTEIELAAMAAEAKIGLSSMPQSGKSTPAATGISKIL